MAGPGGASSHLRGWRPAAPRGTAPARRVVATILACLLLAACTAGPRTGEAGVAWLSDALGEDAVGRLDAALERYPHVRALLVSVDGDLIVERYQHDGGPDVHANVHSVTKSIISTLVGIALEDGAIPSVDATLADLLPPHHLDDAHPDTAALTLEQLLTMTAGFPQHEWEDYLAIAASGDFPRSLLAAGPVVPPGRYFVYNDYGPDLISVILTETTGRSTLDYAEEKLFGPLDIPTEPATRIVVHAAAADAEAAYEAAAFAWPEEEQGYHTGGSFLKLTPVDLLKLGQLYLQDGRWGEEQIVPADYIQRATKPVEVPGASDDYGYLWWSTQFGDHEAFAAHGHGGQLIEVVPDLDLVLVVTAAALDDAELLGDFTGHNPEGFRLKVLDLLLEALDPVG
jgi:CubicO group peptidase (beta-lactamase class C family)